MEYNNIYKYGKGKMGMVKKFLSMFIYTFLFMFSTYSVFADLTNNNDLFYSYDVGNVSGTTMVDLSGSGNNGTCSGMTGCNTVPGILNNASNFDGLNDYINTGNSVSSSTFALTGWFNADSYGGIRYLIDNQGSNSGFILRLQDDMLYFYVGNGVSFVNINNGFALNTSQWYHYIAQFNDANNTMELYFDNVLVATGSQTTKQVIGNNIYLGSSSGSANWYDGLLDETGFYSRVLNSSERAQLYNNGNAFNPYAPTPVGTVITFNNPQNGDILNTTSFTLNVSLSQNTSADFSFNGAPEINFISNDVEGTYFIDSNAVLSPKIGTKRIVNNDVNAEQYCQENFGSSFSSYTNTSIASNKVTWNGTAWIDTVAPESINILTCDIAQGLQNITVTTTDNSSSTIFFTIDTGNPSLDVSLPNEYNSLLNFNFSQYINFSDVGGSGIDTCIVEVVDQSNTTCTSENYNFTYAQNTTINIYLTDNAGNTNNSLNNIMLVNPTHYFYMQLDNGTPVTNFTFGGKQSSNGAVNYTTFNDSLSFGVNSLLFEKLGYASENFSFTLTNTSELNQTFNVTQSTIVLNFYDRETSNFITQLITIDIVPPSGGVGFSGNTSTGSLNISDLNFLSGQYQLFAQSTGYEPETVVFTYSNQEILNIDVFMLNSTSPNIGTIQIIVKSNDATFVDGAIVKLLEYDGSTFSFFTASEAVTNANGEAFLNVELGTKLYKFQAVKNGVSTTTNQEVISIDGDSRLLTLDLVSSDKPFTFENLNYNIELFNSTDNLSRTLVFSWTSTDNLVYTGKVSFWKVVGAQRLEKVFPDITQSSSSGIINTGEFPINNSFTLLVEVTIEIDGQTQILDSYRFPPVGGITDALEFWGLNILIPLFLYMIGFSVGLAIGNENLGAILKIAFIWVSVLIVPGTITETTCAVLTIFAIAELVGGFKRK